MQPEFCVVAVERFDEACALEDFKDVSLGRSTKRERLVGRFGLASRGFDKLNEAQIRFGIFRNIKNNGIVTRERFSNSLLQI